MSINPESMSLLLWFQLIDSTTKKPYKETRADKVSVSSSADVVDFRDAVKAKYDQPGYLKDIPSGALLVYKNNAAFVTNDDPLKEDGLVVGLGTSKQEALIVLVPPSIQPQDSFSLRQEFLYLQMRMERQLNELVANFSHTPTSFSSAGQGELEYAKLKEYGRIIDVEPTEDGDAFWSQDIQIEANAIDDEADFETFITPYFSEILQKYGLVYVNSSRFPWLSQSNRLSSKTDLKPDGFVTHPGMFRAKSVPDDGVQRPSKLLFGVPEKGLFDCVILFESQLTISSGAFGQVIQYVQHFLPKGEARVILFDRWSFWLITCLKSFVDKVEISKWTNNGSKCLFENFICKNVSPWVSHLTKACLHFNVKVVEGNSFLGHGAFGRVFKVIQPNEEVLALKIVERFHVRRLHQEHYAMTKAQHTRLTAIVAENVMDTLECAAFLLKPVGKPLSYPKTREEVCTLFELLWQLHNKGVIHGDPRVPNVIVHKNKLLWIDLVDVFESTTSRLRRLDAKILTLSVLRVSLNFELDSTVLNLIRKYGNIASVKNIHHLANAVYEILQVTR